MDAGIVSALAALAGSVIGGMTSLAASWLSQDFQARAGQLAADKTRRQDLYKDFIEEASKLYGEALTSDKAEIHHFVGLYAMVSRMRVLSSPKVIEAADGIVHLIVDTYFAPNKTLRDIRQLMQSPHSQDIDPLRKFSEACREDIQTLRPA
ncbi:MAG TPA: hypothetical protein VMU08_18005 [Rhizomicrobium sp.]|nr:hypothetical protein [Rhizomicrobium sp.]